VILFLCRAGSVSHGDYNRAKPEDAAVESKYYENWHLAKNNSEFVITEFEWSIIRFSEAFARWVTTTGDILIDADIKFSEHLILHVVRMHNRPKNSATIARMINRDDIPNIQYSLRKLESANLIQKSKEKPGKIFSYSVTGLGRKVTDEYSNIRSDLLMKAIGTISNIDERLEEMTQLMGVMTGIYEEMARSSSTFSAQY
jgi:predicted MarR family transcription regulator